MDFREALSIAWGSLIANPLRSFLTLFGIIVGVTAIIAVIAVINGLNLYVQERMITLGPASFEVNRFGMIMSREEFLRAIRRNREIKMADAAAIRERCPLVKRLAIKAYESADVAWRNLSAQNVSIKGATPEILLVETYEIGAGRALSDEDETRGASVTFLGADVADLLFPSADPIGKEVKISGRRYEVIGVGARRGEVFGQSRDNYALIPLSTHRKAYSARNFLSFVIEAQSPDLVEACMDEVRTVLRARHHLAYKADDDFGMVTAEGMQAFWRRMTSTIFQVALFVVGISLVVGGIVIMNIMLVSVIERTREVGLRKALGARHRDIRRQFMLESALLASAGGIVGVILAWGIALAMNRFSPLPAVFPWWAPFLALGLSSMVGLFFGIYPAVKAARLHPIEALRSER